MFSHCYQSGDSIELYNGHDKSLYSKWKFSGRHSKIFDSTLRNYMHILDIGKLSKMELPKSAPSYQNGFTKPTLGLFQSFIVFQIYLFSSKQFSIEIGISNTTKTKRRLLFSTNNQVYAISSLHCRIPILNFPIGKWVNFSIDVLDFVSDCSKDLTFRSIDYISLSMSGKVRRIFTMRVPLLTISGDGGDPYSQDIPNKFKLPEQSGLVAENININSNKVISQIDIEQQMSRQKNLEMYNYDKMYNANVYNNSFSKKMTFGKVPSVSKSYSNFNNVGHMGNMGKVGMMIMNSGNVNKSQQHLKGLTENIAVNEVSGSGIELLNQKEFVNISNNNEVNEGNAFQNYNMFNKEEYTNKFMMGKGVSGHIKKSFKQQLGNVNNNNSNSKWESNSIEDLGALEMNDATNIHRGMLNQISTIKNDVVDDKSELEMQSKDFGQGHTTDNNVIMNLQNKGNISNNGDISSNSGGNVNDVAEKNEKNKEGDNIGENENASGNNVVISNSDKNNEKVETKNEEPKEPNINDNSNNDNNNQEPKDELKKESLQNNISEDNNNNQNLPKKNEENPSSEYIFNHDEYD